MRFLHLLAVLTLLVANANSLPSCLAENGTTAAGASLSRRTAPRELRHEVLKSIPGDVKVPVPPDAKFMAGYRSQYNSSRMITELRFQTNNSQSKMLDWYQQVLSGAGWSVKVNGAGQQSSIAASKPGLFCSVRFRESGSTSATPASLSSSMVLLNYSENR